VAALGRGDYEQAYQQATAFTRPGELAAHAPHALVVAMDLVEAAVHTRRNTEATGYVAALHQAGVAALSPRLALLVSGASALAAPGDAAPGLFEEALAVPGADRWSFDLARIRLAYGQRLRRTGASTGARVHLAAAAQTFDRLGARPWSARAGAELRATGQTRSRPGRPGPAGLTPQESEIAQLAAAGLSNKEIGARLYLSHRTVGSHLHHLFPKLGVTSRAALRDALSRMSAAEDDALSS
jgi:DNA-binding CsgD family transcriptional regulator